VAVAEGAVDAEPGTETLGCPVRAHGRLVTHRGKDLRQPPRGVLDHLGRPAASGTSTRDQPAAYGGAELPNRDP
jgi:hypothetical protein